jgi:hypothetical protein
MASGEVVDGEQYHGFALPAGDVTGVIRILADMGQAPAAVSVDRMINRLDVSLVVVIGTAASLDAGVRLGDVVVADQIQEYLRKGKIVPAQNPGSVTMQRAAEGGASTPGSWTTCATWGGCRRGRPRSTSGDRRRRADGRARGQSRRDRCRPACTWVRWPPAT